MGRSGGPHTAEVLSYTRPTSQPSVSRFDLEGDMSTERRSSLVLIVSLVLAAILWICTLPNLISVSNAIWSTLAIAVIALVALKFRRHAELPGSVKLH